jgi:uncharacterized protein YcnI
MRTRRSTLAVAGVAATLMILVGHNSQSHVVVMPDTVQPGHPARVILVVAEGCAGSPTTSLRVEIPAGIALVKPQPKPGWKIELTRERVPRPGTDVTRERVTAITWRGGPVPDDHYEEFALIVIPPKTAGELYLPATQTCEKGQISWNETPSAKSAAEGMEYPAPVLKIQGSSGKH